MRLAIKITLFSLAFVPLVVDPGVFFPYITGKSLLIRIAITISAVLFSIYCFYSDLFKKEVLERIYKIKNSSIFLFTISFFIVFSLSTLFAFFKYRAFYGDVERAEGFIGMAFFFGFFLLSSFVFCKKDWLIFFKLTLITSVILFISAFSQFFKGADRPESYTGNPIYLAQIFLFAIFCSIYVLKESQNLFWKIFAWIIVPASVFGIFITQTRGVIFGLMVAAILVLLYLSIFGKGIKIFNKLNLRKTSVFLFVAIAAFSALFYSTKDASLWKRAPGLERLSQMTTNDPTLRTRLISLGVSWRAINPTNEGLKRFLIGWGPENFGIAYNKYYNPDYYKYEGAWFDRAHDKLIDVLLMNGVVGLLVYLVIWISLAVVIFKNRKNLFVSSLILFFGLAYFIQNLFVFDSISTYIPFFAFLSFSIFVFRREDAPISYKKNTSSIFCSIFGIFTFVLIFFLIAFTLVPYFQMRGYLALIQGKSFTGLLSGIDSYLSPYTYAQENIRTNLLDIGRTYFGKSEDANNLFLKAINKMEELVQKEPHSPRNFIRLGQSYGYLGEATKNPAYFKKSEENLMKARELSPTRQDTRYILGYIYAMQGKNSEAIKLLEDTVALSPDVGDSNYYLGIILSQSGKANTEKAFESFERALNSGNLRSGNNDLLKQAYQNFLSYFYEHRDKDRIIASATRLKKFDPSQKGQLDSLIEFAENGMWNSIIIER